MTINKEVIDALVIQLKKNFKELVIIALVYLYYETKQEVKQRDRVVERKDIVIERFQQSMAAKDSAHLQFVLLVNSRVQNALDELKSKKK